MSAFPHPHGQVGSRPRLTATLPALLASACVAVGLIGVAPAQAATTSLADVKINEVESNGDTVNGDWVELYNNGAETVDLAGVILSDSDNTHVFTIAAGTQLAGGAWAAFRVDDPAVSGSFGLGSADSARLFPAGTTDLGSAIALDQYDWTEHAATSYGRNPDGTGDFAATASTTFGDANDFEGGPIGDIGSVKLNEVESNGDADGDWIELYNTSADPVNLGGAILSDNDNGHQLVIPANTMITGNGYTSFRTDDPAVTGNFGLGAADKARLFAPGDVTLSTPVDEFSWSTHAVITYGRTVPGAGIWKATSASTRGAGNDFSSVTAPNLAGVVINEVESTGDDTDGDWIELKNTTGSSVDLSAAILSDNSNGHVYRIPNGSTLAAGAVKAFRVDDPAVLGNFGLGDDDRARLFQADAVDLAAATVVNQQTWTTHAPITYGLNGSTWATSNKSTFGAANDFTSTITPDLSWVVLNELESDGDATHGDWIELLNTSNQPIAIGGAVLSDGDDTHAYPIPAGTTIAAGDTYTVDIDNATGGFGLGGEDAVRLYRSGAVVGTSIPLDHHEWSNHAPVTFARTANGFGDWTNSSSATYDAPN